MSANSCFIQQHMHCASDTAGTTFNLITMLTEKKGREIRGLLCQSVCVFNVTVCRMYTWLLSTNGDK